MIYIYIFIIGFVIGFVSYNIGYKQGKKEIIDKTYEYFSDSKRLQLFGNYERFINDIK